MSRSETSHSRRGVPRADLGASLLGIGLLLGWLVLFTIGSQIDSSPYKTLASPAAFAMFVLTNRETSVSLLGVVASCLGTWRRRNLNPDGVAVTTAPGIAYTSGAISGLIFALIIVACPALLSGLFPMLTMERDARNYDVFAVIGSFVAFLSGFDPNIFDQWIAQWGRKLGGERADNPAGADAAAAPGRPVSRAAGRPYPRQTA